MSQTNMTSCVVFSVFQHTKCVADDLIRMWSVCSFLRGIHIPFIVMMGSSNGRIEMSLQLHIRYLDTVVMLAKQYNQESIFIVDASNRASLMYMSDGHQEDLGMVVPSYHKPASDSWSYDPERALYYAAVGDEDS